MSGQSSLLASFALALALLTSVGARADATNQVLLARLGGEQVDDTLAAQVDVGLRSEMKKVVGARLVGEAPEAPAGCEGGACAAELANAHGAALVVIATLRKGEDDMVLVARLLDADGKRIVVAERRFATTPDFRVLRGLATQLLVPGEYTGKVRFVDVPSGAQVLVDRIPLAASELAGPLALSVGEHTVVVERVERTPFHQNVAVAFDSESQLSLTPADVAGVGAVTVRPPLWPGLAAGGVALLGVAALVGASVDLLVTTIVLDNWYGGWAPPSDGDLRIAYSEKLAASTTTFAPLRRGQRNDAVFLGGAAGVTMVASVAAAALLTDWALRGGDGEAE